MRDQKRYATFTNMFKAKGKTGSGNQSTSRH